MFNTYSWNLFLPLVKLCAFCETFLLLSLIVLSLGIFRFPFNYIDGLVTWLLVSYSVKWRKPILLGEPVRVCRDGSVVKSKCCFCRRPELESDIGQLKTICNSSSRRSCLLMASENTCTHTWLKLLALVWPWKFLCGSLLSQHQLSSN